MPVIQMEIGLDRELIDVFRLEWDLINQFRLTALSWPMLILDRYFRGRGVVFRTSCGGTGVRIPLLGLFTPKTWRVKVMTKITGTREKSLSRNFFSIARSTLFFYPEFHFQVDKFWSIVAYIQFMNFLLCFFLLFVYCIVCSYSY